MSKKYINDSHCSSQKVFGRPTSSFEVLFLTTRQVFMMTFSCQKNTLTTALVHRKLHLVVQLPRIKLNLQRQLLSTYDGVMLSKISVSDGLVGNIVLLTRLLPTDVDGFLPSVIWICDSFLCFCDDLWPSQISLFFVVLYFCLFLFTPSYYKFVTISSILCIVFPHKKMVPSLSLSKFFGGYFYFSCISTLGW